MTSSRVAGPLEGIRVLELARAAPGELVGRLLADMGADVIRVGTPAAVPDESARRRAAFSYTNRNKRSVGLDLKAPEGKAAYVRLVDSTDVVVEGFRPGVMARLGIDHDTLAARNPRLITLSLSGFGQQSAGRDRPGHDITYLAAAGILGLLGEPGQRPLPPMNLVADYGGASLHGALGVMFALFARERSGRGQHVDVSYVRSAVGLLAATPNMERIFSDGTVPVRGSGVVAGAYAFYTSYETSDGRYLAVGCTEPHLWRNFCTAIGRPELAPEHRVWEHHHRPANTHERAVRGEVAAVVRSRPLADWLVILADADADADAAVAPVRTVPEFLETVGSEPGVVTEIDHPELGPVRQFGVPIGLSETPGTVRKAASYPGEDTESVLREIGLSAAQIAALRRAGTI